jgi:hypothetical protein
MINYASINVQEASSLHDHGTSFDIIATRSSTIRSDPSCVLIAPFLKVRPLSLGAESYFTWFCYTLIFS